MRIYVYRSNTETGTAADLRVGYFDSERAQYWNGNKEWDGRNQIDVNTREADRGQGIYLTAGRRWVLRAWTNWDCEMTGHAFVTPEEASAWLLFNGHDDAVTEHFGEPEEEVGPGRPPVGGLVKVRLGEELLPRVEAWAGAHAGGNVAAAVRALIRRALALESAL
ncbi:MAG TPA: hypothetical protein VK486_06300 [Thermoleophilaceae bacterium]|nr:hypothetical protein [Thermoleophilaceae bacterium]